MVIWKKKKIKWRYLEWTALHTCSQLKRVNLSISLVTHKLKIKKSLHILKSCWNSLQATHQSAQIIPCPCKRYIVSKDYSPGYIWSPIKEKKILRNKNYTGIKEKIKREVTDYFIKYNYFYPTCSTSQARLSSGGKRWRYSCSIGLICCFWPGMWAPLPSEYNTSECKSSQAATLVWRSLDCWASFTTRGRNLSENYNKEKEGGEWEMRSNEVEGIWGWTKISSRYYLKLERFLPPPPPPPPPYPPNN